MKKAIDEFGEELWDYDVGLFYFAGHGIQVNGSNYLIPVDANLISEKYVEYDCVEADRVLANMDASNALVNIVILDVGRNNPFERSWNRSSIAQGLAFMNAPNGTLIAYATAPGSIASDGEGKNGIYTEALLENIGKPDITVIQVFQNVRSLVSRRTRDRQIPWESTSLTRDFYFNPQNIPEAISYTDSSYTSPTLLEESRIIPASSEERTEGVYEKNTRGILIDQRDGTEYKWVRIGDQVWMAENLNHEFSDSRKNGKIYGRLYSWIAANEVCPEGWHLPSDEEWMELEIYLGMDNAEVVKQEFRGRYEGGKLKEIDTSHWTRTTHATTNETGFSALPGGQYSQLWGIRGHNIGAYFWTSTHDRDWMSSYARHLDSREDRIDRYLENIDNRLSVRCAKDQ